MEKLNFKTVGQFLVALEEGPLYCSEKCKFTFNSVENIVVVQSLINKDNKARHDHIQRLKFFVEGRTFTRKPLPQDKDLVWCWDDKYKTCRCAYFYDAKNRRVFDFFGNRNGSSYDNYEVIPKNSKGLWDAPFEWANEAVKHLED